MDDPWTSVSREGKLNDGTKERILNTIYRQPQTITQIAQHLDLAPSGVHRHINEMLATELIREVSISEEDRRSVVERYYCPNFPVALAPDREAFQGVIQDIAVAFARAFRARESAISEAFGRTNSAFQGQRFDVVLHYIYTAAGRRAREILQAEGMLAEWPEHSDGSRWLWWAEEMGPPPPKE